MHRGSLAYRLSLLSRIVTNENRYGKSVLLGIFGVLTHAYDAYGWAALFLVPGVLAFAWGYWEITIARSASART